MNFLSKFLQTTMGISWWGRDPLGFQPLYSTGIVHRIKTIAQNRDQIFLRSIQEISVYEEQSKSIPCFEASLLREYHNTFLPLNVA